MELTEEMLQTYAPMTWENTPPSEWEEIRIDGKIFMIPQNLNFFGQFHFILRGDLMEQYNIPPVTTLEDLTTYFEILVDNGFSTPFNLDPNTYGFITTDLMAQRQGWTAIAGSWNYGLLFEINSQSGQLISMFDTPEYMEVLKLMRKWNESGFIPRNALTNTVSTGDLFKDGTSAIMIHNMGTANVIFGELKETQPDWNILLVDGTAGQSILPGSAMGGGLSINRLSRNPERMLMATDLLRNDRDLNFLISRGIQGVHWDFYADGSDENLIIAGPDSERYFFEQNSVQWSAFRNTKFQPVIAGSIEGFAELNDSLASRRVDNPLLFFVLDDENIRAEIAAITALSEQYLVPLRTGFVDPEEGLAEYRAQLDRVGFEKVREEIQRQVNEYLAGFNN
jgi:putative aldouronate transport system substrate-binding protein